MSCSNCKHCRYDEESKTYYCRRSYTDIYEPEESDCDDFESNDY